MPRKMNAQMRPNFSSRLSGRSLWGRGFFGTPGPPFPAQTDVVWRAPRRFSERDVRCIAQPPFLRCASRQASLQKCPPSLPFTAVSLGTYTPQ